MDALAGSRFVVVGPGDGPLTPSLEDDTVYVPEVFVLSADDRAELDRRLARGAPTMVGAGDRERFTARVEAELEAPLAERLFTAAYDLGNEPAPK